MLARFRGQHLGWISSHRLCSALVVDRRETAERRMATVRIVPRLDEVEHSRFGLSLRAKAMLNEQLALERCVERRSKPAIERYCLPSPALSSAHRSCQHVE